MVMQTKTRKANSWENKEPLMHQNIMEGYKAARQDPSMKYIEHWIPLSVISSDQKAS